MDKDFILNRIAELREKRNISERQMSREMGHSPTYLSNLATYKGLPTMEVVMDCCNYFGISLSDFFQETLKTEPSSSWIDELFDKEDQAELVRLLNAMDKKSAKALMDVLRKYAGRA